MISKLFSVLILSVITYSRSQQLFIILRAIKFILMQQKSSHDLEIDEIRRNFTQPSRCLPGLHKPKVLYSWKNFLKPIITEKFNSLAEHKKTSDGKRFVEKQPNYIGKRDLINRKIEWDNVQQEQNCGNDKLIENSPPQFSSNICTQFTPPSLPVLTFQLQLVERGMNTESKVQEGELLGTEGNRGDDSLTNQFYGSTVSDKELGSVQHHETPQTSRDSDNQSAYKDQRMETVASKSGQSNEKQSVGNSPFHKQKHKLSYRDTETLSEALLSDEYHTRLRNEERLYVLDKFMKHIESRHAIRL